MDTRPARKLLSQEHDRLSGILSALEEGTANATAEGSTFSESATDQHPADKGTETFEIEKDMSIRANVEAELADVERALHRLKEGSYGSCEACGKRIPKARLEAIPAARFCVKDQARFERERRVA